MVTKLKPLIQDRTPWTGETSSNLEVFKSLTLIRKGMVTMIQSSKQYINNINAQHYQDQRL